MKKYIMILTIPIITLAIIIGAFAENTKYDGYWWMNLSSGEQEKFLDGFSDCYIYDAGGKHASSPAIVAAKNVSEFYTERKDKKSIPVTEVYLGIKDNTKWSGIKHGYFDGDYWRLLEKNERLYFVRGFFVCKLYYTKHKLLEDENFCVKKISHQYRVGENGPSDVIDLKTATKKIGDVIDRHCQ